MGNIDVCGMRIAGCKSYAYHLSVEVETESQNKEHTVRLCLSVFGAFRSATPYDMVCLPYDLVCLPAASTAARAVRRRIHWAVPVVCRRHEAALILSHDWMEMPRHHNMLARGSGSSVRCERLRQRRKKHIYSTTDRAPIGYRHPFMHYSLFSS